MVKIGKLHWSTYVLGTCGTALIGLCVYSFLERSLLEGIALSGLLIFVFAILSIPFFVQR